MDGYQVDLPRLGILIDNLTQAAERISGANDLLRAATPAQLGSHEIDQAGRAFQDRWEYGTRKITEGVRHLVDALQQTRRTYQRAEDEVSRLFSADRAQPSGPGDVGPRNVCPGGAGSGGADPGVAGPGVAGSGAEAGSVISTALDGGGW